MNKADLLKQAENLGIEASAVSPEGDAGERARAKPNRSNAAAERFAIECARVMADDRCEDIVVLDLRGVSPVCDYFVLANGTSDRQMRGVVDRIKVTAKSEGETPYSTSGYEESTWIVVDYVDVVVHLFNEERRAYYDLDALWGDCPKVAFSR